MAIAKRTINNVDLVILSVFETVLGGKLGTVQKLQALATSFKAGESEQLLRHFVQLMDAFYRSLETCITTKVEALRQGQIALIIGNYPDVDSKQGSIAVALRGRWQQNFNHSASKRPANR